MRHPQGAPPARSKRLSLALVVALVAVVGTVAVATVASAGTSGSAAAEQEKIKVGLITKDVTNPFFVKMRAGATAQAKKLGAELIYAAGKNSSDNAGQITAIENMVTAGVKGILITVADAKAENAAIAIGLGLNFVGIDPIRALYVSAILNGLAAPPLILLMLILSRSRRAELRTGWLSDWLMVIALLVMSASAAVYLIGSFVG